MHAWIAQQGDFLLFALAAVAVLPGLMLGMRRWKPQRSWRVGVWLVLAVILGAGWFVVQGAGVQRQREIGASISALVPTYAAEIERLGHATVGLNTGPDDPRYLAMIAAEIRWLKLNPIISDIYTLRRGADGQPYFVVDAETDYDHNGQFEGARESRTAIGEMYRENDPGLERAFQGYAGCADAPVTDRWGTWISAYAPLHDAQGNVEAVLGVDYDAGQWREQIAAVRRRRILMVALVVVMLMGGAAALALLQADLAMRERTEQQLRIQSTAMEAAANAIVITDNAGTIQWVNPAFTTLTGYTAAEAIGRNPRVLKSGQHAGEFYRHIWQTITTGNIWTGHLTNRRKDGTLYDEEMTITPMRDVDGQIVRFIAIKQDISIRRRTEAALREAEAQYRRLVEQVPAITYVAEFGAAGRWHFVSPQIESLLGFSPADWTADPTRWAKQLHPDDRDRALAAEAHTHKTGTPLRCEYRLLARDGHPVWCRDEAVVVRTDTGAPPVMQGLITDITDRKLAEEQLDRLHHQLEDASRAAGMAEVATSVLHNVGNVLNSVNISAALVTDRLQQSRIDYLGRAATLLRAHSRDLPEFLTRDLKGRLVPDYLVALADHLVAERADNLAELAALNSHVDHIKQIVAMQQTYAKVAGLVEILPVADLVEDALRLNEGALVRHEVEVIREFHECPPLPVEKHKVLQILVNLIRNAKYALDEGRSEPKVLTVRVAAAGPDRVAIAVGDNGVGIPAELLPRIFELGFTTRPNGHGIGLHSAAVTAQELGGALRVHSAGRGQGATFTLELPRERKVHEL